MEKWPGIQALEPGCLPGWSPNLSFFLCRKGRVVEPASQGHYEGQMRCYMLTAYNSARHINIQCQLLLPHFIIFCFYFITLCYSGIVPLHPIIMLLY